MSNAAIVSCQSCGQRLRVPASDSETRIRCPHCGSEETLQPDAGQPHDVMSNRVETELQDARARLLDLTLKNRLLNHRTTKRRTLRIVDEVPHEVYKTLAGPMSTFDKQLNAKNLLKALLQ